MAGVNKAIILGNVGRKDVPNTTGGNKIVKLAIATSYNIKVNDKYEEKTEWHNITLFGKLADVAGRYVNKGDKVYIEGSLQTSKWTDKNGVERFSTSVLANKLELAGKKGSQEPPAEKMSDDMSDIPF